ncbi:hypothetical protein AUJ46_02240 [Candidatus Peregrinibacteria bacterium CG1_02_54_53]|nr:MAG: hypothetical protein AUJ46_02240 [Candidatus Peregrinibacteria bacterium CG1_02_54_53]
MSSSPYVPGEWARAFGLVSGFFFILCVVWSYLLRDPVLQDLHMQLLRLFTLDIGGPGMGVISFIAGLVITAVSGGVFGLLVAMSLNYFAQKRTGGTPVV